MFRWEKFRLFKKSIITRTGDDSEQPEPYLIRWNIISFGFFSIKLHKFLLSDDDCLHDHPWSFLSIILKGGYFETTGIKLSEKSQFIFAGFKLPIEQRTQWVTWHRPGSILWRPAPWPHRVVLKTSHVDFKTGKKVLQPAWTLVVTFARKRDWGFYTPFGWMPFRKYNSSHKCE